MATFIENLWTSVFTPGPTPTLLIATNVTFFCLQTLLFALLIATYSIHFLVLSLLSAGLWVSINWFAGELQTAQAQAEADKAKDQKRAEREEAEKSEAEEKRVAEEGDDEAGTGTETEVEGGKPVRRSTRVKQQVQVTGREEGTAQRRKGGETSGDISTDSEWEKVEGER
ncbi:ER protein Pkr1-domain-containing protein [Elsinoe ampelina]|uniref:ER protein Pkr1-domain-containing protein n=1 Tax=Elsinoe ampelina TaxID=302913 RepID=A0A6A6G2Z7_9PEZI|nr:ER protein Pkr1-domain-containing protein [Elsinoe ampelina]